MADRGMDRGPGGTRAYIGSYTSSGGRGLTAASVDPATGRLTRISDTAEVPDPSFLALPHHGRALYAVSETEEGAVAVFDLGNPDRPRLQGTAPVRGAFPTHLSLAAGGRAVLTANYGSGSVSVLPAADTDVPGPVSDVLGHSGSGPVEDRQEGPHAHQVLPDPSGRWILSADLGSDRVYIHALDTDTMALGVHGELRLRPGHGPRHLAFHPAGRIAYLVCELEPVVIVCAWNAEAGALSEIAEVPVIPDSAKTPNYPSNPVVSPDGRFLYVGNRGRNTIAVLALGDGGRTARPVTWVGCGGDWPRHLAAGPVDGRLYVCNERSGTVAWFDVDRRTGVPRQTGSLEAPAASCVVFR